MIQKLREIVKQKKSSKLILQEVTELLDCLITEEEAMQLFNESKAKGKPRAFRLMRREELEELIADDELTAEMTVSEMAAHIEDNIHDFDFDYSGSLKEAIRIQIKNVVRSKFERKPKTVAKMGSDLGLLQKEVVLYQRIKPIRKGQTVVIVDTKEHGIAYRQPNRLQWFVNVGSAKKPSYELVHISNIEIL